MTIKEISTNTNNLKLTVIIKRAMQGVASNGNPYLNLLLQDKEASITARLWDVKTHDIEQLTIGQVIHLVANSLTYAEQLQLKVVNYKVVENPTEELMKSLISSAPIEVNKEWELLMNTINHFDDVVLKKILSHLLKKYEKDFITRAAAVKVHHNVRNGLLWHTITMLKMAKEIVKVYHDREINHDLLFAGIIMHDFGKLWELNTELMTSFTLQGQMMGHIVLGSEQVRVACQELKINDQEEIVILLQHLILASHGKHEYGSPVLPKTLEAEILHHVDNLDAKITIIDEALKLTKVGETTNRLNSVENRVFLKHIKNK